MTRTKLAVTFKVRGPILTRSSAIAALGVDAAMAKGTFEDSTGTARQRFYLPGSLIKGLLREAWQQMGVLNTRYERLAMRWLGEESQSDNAPARGLLVFEDFADLTTDAEKSELRYRIQIDQEREATNQGQLQVIDSPYAPGEEVIFSGAIRALADVSEEDRADIERGLYWIRSVGGAKTSGFGEVIEVSSTVEKKTMKKPGTYLPNGVWELDLTFSQPLIFSKLKIAENLFESSEALPGGGLKGAIANMIEREPGRYQALQQDLYAVGFTHAFPAESNKARPDQIPLSVVYREPKFFDAIRKDRVAGGKFQIDWKDKESKAAEACYSRPTVKQELRVRTSINSETGRARDEALFGWQTMLPFGLTWRARVNTEEISDQARAQLEELLRFGIEPLGKTKAIASVELRPSDARQIKQAPDYVVTLQTPALLINPEDGLRTEDGPGSTSRDDLRRALQTAWKELSAGSLEMKNYFQRATLAGGEYFHKRFKGPKVYKPYLLSSAGSTFLLRPAAGHEAKAAECLNMWSRTGLPVRGRIADFYEIPRERGRQWQHCPYLPENGYGEIAVNHANPACVEVA